MVSHHNNGGNGLANDNAHGTIGNTLSLTVPMKKKHIKSIDTYIRGIPPSKERLRFRRYKTACSIAIARCRHSLAYHEVVDP